jgi:uncharacterized Zn finger protein
MQAKDARDCPHCASSDLEVVPVTFEGSASLAVHCNECGAFGPPSHTDEPKHAISPGISAWAG